jgi:peptide/nickel transport system permease protein
MLGANASQEKIDAKKHELGYDKPVIQQYADYMTGLLHGDMQMSLRTRRPVTTDLADYLPATIELAFYGVLMAVVLGGALGLLTAARFTGAGALRVVLVGFASMPVFVLALLGILLFYRRLGWLPATGRTAFTDFKGRPASSRSTPCWPDGWTSSATPSGTSSCRPSAWRSDPPSPSAECCGRAWSACWAPTTCARPGPGPGRASRAVPHALRNSIGPALSMTGLQVGLMFAGVVVLESIFAWPGIGFYTVQSIPRNDFPAIAGVTLVLGAGYVLVNALVEIAQAWADPRLKLT